MAHILSIDQKQSVFQAIPSDHIVEGVGFTAQKVYTSQMTKGHSSFPAIALNYAQDGIRGEVVDVGEGVVYYKAMLTIHILAKNYDDRSSSGRYVNGAQIAEGIAQGVMDQVKTWKTPLDAANHDLFIVDDFDITPLDNRGVVPEYSGVFDYVFSVYLWHI